jgi:hypothetical protein
MQQEPKQSVKVHPSVTLLEGRQGYSCARCYQMSLLLCLSIEGNPSPLAQNKQMLFQQTNVYDEVRL